MKLPKAVTRVIEEFEKLPGIGPKSAQRLGFYLLHVPQSQLESFADALENLKKNTMLCSICKNVGEEDPCWICTDMERNQDTICIVEDALDVLAIERSGTYKGVYHVLHGVIDPLSNVGPDDIFIPQLIKRVEENELKEIILATNPTMEGEATAMYIVEKIKRSSASYGGDGMGSLIVTRIGRGLPIGADLEYADETTINRAMEGRREF